MATLVKEKGLSPANPTDFTLRLTYSEMHVLESVLGRARNSSIHQDINQKIYNLHTLIREQIYYEKS